VELEQELQLFGAGGEAVPRHRSRENGGRVAIPGFLGSNPPGGLPHTAHGAPQNKKIGVQKR
jgi:hypothetical protein